MTENTFTKALSDWTVLGLKQEFDRGQRLKCLRSQGGKWKAALIATSVNKAEERIELGVFATKSDAELAHDLHMLRVQGLKSSGELAMVICHAVAGLGAAGDPRRFARELRAALVVSAQKAEGEKEPAGAFDGEGGADRAKRQ